MLSLFDFVVLSLTLLVLSSIWWYATIPSNLPPGPRGLPFFGSIFHTWKAATLHKKLHAWTKIYGPIYKFYVAEKMVLVLGDLNAIQDALVKQGNAFAGRPRMHVTKDKGHIGMGLLNSEGECWRTQRRFALSTFREFGFGKPLLESQIKEECEHLISALQSHNGEPFDPAMLVNNAVANIICVVVLGRRFAYDDQSFHTLLTSMRKRLTESNVGILSPFVISEGMAKVQSMLPQVRNFINESSVIDEFSKKQIAATMKNFNLDHDTPTNYIQAFYKAQKEREDNSTFTDQQLLTTINNVFIAGTATTATTLRWAIFYLAHNPQIQEQVYDELKREIGGGRSPNYADRTKMPFVDATIMEVQRMANMLPMGLLRRTMTACRVRGYDIPEDTVVVALLTGALRDPRVYQNAEMFDPSRFLNSNRAASVGNLIPYQAGKRVCLGESLARMELFLFFTTLVSNFKFSFPTNHAPPSADDERVSIIREPPLHEIRAIRRTDW